jgi:hypothetical protein
MTTAEKTLAYGTRHAAEDLKTARAAWGARLIWPNDILGDRTDTFGSEPDKKLMFKLLNERAPQPDQYLHLLLAEDIDSRSHYSMVFYEDDDIKVIASPQGSCGYLYVTAVLKAAR